MIAALERGLRVLACFTQAEPVLRLSDIADRLGIPAGSAHRTLRSLEALGYIAQDEATRHYRVGLRALDLTQACIAGLVVPDVALPFLEELAEATRRSANLAILDGTEIVFAARASTVRLMHVNLTIGSRLPAHATSMGKVLLASLTTAELHERLRPGLLTRFTPATLADLQALETELAVVRDRGYAFSLAELEPNLASVAAPLRNARGQVVAAINVATFVADMRAMGMGPDAHAEALVASLVPHVVHTAHIISGALGFRAGAQQTVGARVLHDRGHLS